MFHSGDYIIYGTNGVCQVTGICPSPVDPDSKQMYYVIKPLDSFGNSKIFTPVDNDRVFMRKPLSIAEIDELISKIPQIQTLQVQHDKNRKNSYKTAMQKCDPTEYIKVIKTVYEMRLELQKSKKRLQDVDAEFEQKAKYCLYSEFAFVLNIPFEKVEAYIRNKINNTL